MNKETENFQTLLNYSRFSKAAFGILVFGIPALVARMIDRGPASKNIPIFMRGRFFDAFAGPYSASLNKIFFNDNFLANATAGLVYPTLQEFAQGVGWIDGTFDWGDIAAYAVGTLAWMGFEGSAKVIHDRGWSLPIYRALKIKHQIYG